MCGELVRDICTTNFSTASAPNWPSGFRNERGRENIQFRMLKSGVGCWSPTIHPEKIHDDLFRRQYLFGSIEDQDSAAQGPHRHYWPWLRWASAGSIVQRAEIPSDRL